MNASTKDNLVFRRYLRRPSRIQDRLFGVFRSTRSSARLRVFVVYFCVRWDLVLEKNRINLGRIDFATSNFVVGVYL